MATTKAYEIGDFGVSLNVNSDGEIVSLDLDSDSVTEGSTNLYYTNTRARGAISVSGNLTYDSGTGVLGFTMPTTIASLSNHDTDDLTEGSSNLYFTTARARSSVSGSTGITYSSSTGAIALTSGIVTAGTYGDASNVAQVTVDTYGRVTSVSEVAIAGVDNVAYVASTGVLTVETSSGTDYSVDLGIGTTDSPTFQTVTLTGNLDLADNQSVLLGTDDDLTLYHDNSHGYVVNDTGTLFVKADTFSVQNNAGTSTRLTVDSSGTTASGTLVYSTLNDGTTNLTATVAELNRNDITTLGQVQASKVVTADANGYVNFGDNEYIRMGAGNDLQIYHTGTQSIISDTGTGNLNLEGSDRVVLRNYGGTKNYLQALNGDGVWLYYDNNIRLETSNAGVDITGNIAVTGTVDGRDVATDGSKLDGIESGATADQTASEILTLIKTVDGAGSGLDADTVDGLQASSFLRSDANDTATGTLTMSSIAAIPLWVTNANGAYTGVAIGNTGSGDAIFWMDASNGDLGGSDYASIRQRNSDLALVLDTYANAGIIVLQSKGNANGLVVNGTNVGIGTDSPSTKVHAIGSFMAESTSATGNAWTYYKNPDKTWLVGIRGSSSDALSFYDLTTDVERMRIATNGNVGIGTSNPDSALHVQSDAPASATYIKVKNSSSTGTYNYLHLDASAQSQGSGYILKNGVNSGNGLPNGHLYLWNAGGTDSGISFVPNNSIGSRAILDSGGRFYIRSDESDRAYDGTLLTVGANFSGGANTVAQFGPKASGIHITVDNPIISAGAYYNSGWVATGSRAAWMDMSVGQFSFRTKESGLTAGGSAAAVTERMVIGDNRVSIEAPRLKMPTGTSDPATASSVSGDMYYNTSLKTLKIYDSNDGTWNAVYEPPVGSSDNPVTASNISSSSLDAGETYYVEDSQGTILQMEYSGDNYKGQGRGYWLAWEGGHQTNQVSSILGQGFYFTHILIDAVGGPNTYHTQTWSTARQFDGTSSTATASGGTKSGYRLFLGGAGGHGFFNTSQTPCNWGNSTGAFGAGYDGSCGSYPNDLRMGEGTSAPTYTNYGGTWYFWIAL